MYLQLIRKSLGSGTCVMIFVAVMRSILPYVVRINSAVSELNIRFIVFIPLEKAISYAGLETIKSRYYLFPRRVAKIKQDILDLLKKEIHNGNKVVGYGASAKATVLLNYLNLSSSEIMVIADKSQIKQGRFVPGVAIPIISPNTLVKLNPNIIIIFAWNLKNEIARFLSQIFPEDVRILTVIPEISFLNIAKEG